MKRHLTKNITKEKYKYLCKTNKESTYKISILKAVCQYLFTNLSNILK